MCLVILDTIWSSWVPQTTWHNFYIFYRVGNPKKSDPDSSPGNYRQQGGKGEGGEGESGHIWKRFPFWKITRVPSSSPNHTVTQSFPIRPPRSSFSENVQYRTKVFKRDMLIVCPFSFFCGECNWTMNLRCVWKLFKGRSSGAGIAFPIFVWSVLL